MAASLDHRITSRNKVVTSAQAVRLIRDGDTVATSGLVGIGFAEESRSRSRPGSRPGTGRTG